MSKVKLKFIRPGMQTLVQDLGRSGFQNFGVPASGPLDLQSSKLANALVGNKPNTPLLEITLIGPEIKISGDCCLAITGATLNAQLDEKDIPMYEAVNAKDGSILSFGKAIHGCRAYMAVAGEWHLKKWLGSASAATHQPEILTPDSVIQKGSVIKIDSTETFSGLKESIDHRPPFTNTLRVRVTCGPEFSAFSKKTIARFFSHGHRLSADSNRMGYRLDSRIRDFNTNQEELISSGIVPGTIQVTNEGQPIVLLADAQTTGGYYRIANVISDDLDALGQLKPGDVIWFSLID